MRLIDADALVEAIRGLLLDPNITEQVWSSDVLDAVRNAPTVGGWVSVKDRLPEETGEYLFVYDNYYVTIGWFNAYKAEWRLGLSRIGPIGPENITHWMPLPESPKEDDDG